jgi:hypothetical protein
MLVPTVEPHTVVLRWHGNATARTYDIAEKRADHAWRLLASQVATTSYRLHGLPGSLLSARVRARDQGGVPGPWTAAQTVRFRS